MTKENGSFDLSKINIPWFSDNFIPYTSLKQLRTLQIKTRRKEDVNSRLAAALVTVKEVNNLVFWNRRVIPAVAQHIDLDVGMAETDQNGMEKSNFAQMIYYALTRMAAYMTVPKAIIFAERNRLGEQPPFPSSLWEEFLNAIAPLTGSLPAERQSLITVAEVENFYKRNAIVRLYEENPRLEGFIGKLEKAEQAYYEQEGLPELYSDVIKGSNRFKKLHKIVSSHRL